MYNSPTQEFICKNCGAVFIGAKHRKRTMCSLSCNAQFNIKNNPKFSFKTGHQTRVGMKHPKTFIQNRKGTGNPHWKGEEVKYSSLHCWVRDNFTKNKCCEVCGKIGNTDWSHKTHIYTRNREEWQELCRSCHQKYDYAKGLRKKIKTCGKHESQPSPDAKIR